MQLMFLDNDGRLRLNAQAELHESCMRRFSLMHPVLQNSCMFQLTANEVHFGHAYSTPSNALLTILKGGSVALQAMHFCVLISVFLILCQSGGCCMPGRSGLTRLHSLRLMKMVIFLCSHLWLCYQLPDLCSHSSLMSAGWAGFEGNWNTG